MPFFVFTALSLVMVPPMTRSLQPELDRVDEMVEGTSKIGYFRLLKNRRVVFAAMAQFFNIIMFTSGGSVFGPRLTHSYGLSSVWVGACFALPTIFYILTGPIFLPLLTKAFEKRATMMIGFVLLTISAFLIGPSSLLGMPKESAPLMIIGLAFIGTGAAFTIIPVIPEMLDSVKGQYVGQESEVSDSFSAIFNIAGGLGQVVGPSSAGLLNDSVGFNWTFDIIALLLIGYNVLYIIICGGFGSIGRSFKATALRCKRKKETEADSPTHHLLNEESEDVISSGSDSPRAMKKGDEENNSSVDISTDTSLVQDTAYGIN